MNLDPASVAGKLPPIPESTDLLIVGAGPAGLSAALTAIARGARVTLVDENPVPLRTMGEEVPLHFGGRIAATMANQNAVLEHILATHPRLEEALEAGVDVRLGSAVWGLFPPHPGAAWLGSPVAGLADAERAYLVRFKQVIVAAGRRDMGLAFKGWRRPGVMGAAAAHRLAFTYDALESKVAVLLGSDTEALQTAAVLSDRGVRIAAVVEQAAQAVGDTRLLARLVAGGTRVLTGCVIEEALGDSYGVTAVRVGAATVECDTVLLGVGAIATIELLEACGCAVSFQPERGGHVPVVDASQRTSVPFVYAVGDCCGVWPSKTLSEAVAREEGRIAALCAVDGVTDLPPVVPDAPVGDLAARRVAWVRASVPSSEYVCQCEEVTAAEIRALKPPRYLGWTAQTPSPGCEHPDVVKRLTRAGMGPCQGRRCREQIAALVALDCGTALAEVPLATYRTPVRPLTLAQLASLPEAPSMAPHWDSWFGMPTQWIPFWRVTADYTVASRNPDAPPGGE